ncbi:2TM domain-containing protein [Dyadobacter sandarakinus]|uniref:2TM domain-containing protein n=1 Tax=Dyadobacter sandarakinus TaxID=2747268 RepID=A0ABX7I7W7_9BACT|nr:2TM domain-containing protein [Dyadobacter sandarakinus]QRR01885.1 2TM domain-containing protein [Dyadobacter sandarakinus]
METPRNEFLWRKARKRASFKMHLVTYAVVNGGLWLIFLLTTYPFTSDHIVPWPIFPMLGWGIGLATHGLSAYGRMDENTLAQKEYEKLLRQQA